MQQADEMGLTIDRVVTATGSAGTQAGLVVGLEGMNAGSPGAGHWRPAAEGPAGGQCAPPGGGDRRLCRHARRHCAASAVMANCDYVGPGYGQPTPGMTEAVLMLARLEGVLLDPVYSGKAMAGLIDLIRKGEIRKGETVVFLHTGGAVGLFGYTGVFEQAMAG